MDKIRRIYFWGRRAVYSLCTRGDEKSNTKLVLLTCLFQLQQQQGVSTLAGPQGDRNPSELELDYAVHQVRMTSWGLLGFEVKQWRLRSPSEKIYFRVLMACCSILKPSAGQVCGWHSQEANRRIILVPETALN